MNKNPVIATHNGRFHADECFAVALLKQIYPEATYIRTRDPELIEKADIVVDIGGVHDETKNRFDHHQSGGAGMRENEIPYASFGLVWNTYSGQLSQNLEVLRIVEKNLVMPIDAMDNGIDLIKLLHPIISPVLLQSILFLFTPTWQEKERTFEQGFEESLVLAGKILTRSLSHAEAEVTAQNMVLEAYQKSEDKRVIVLETKYPYSVLSTKDEPLFVVVPDIELGRWKVQAVGKGPSTYEVRKPFPSNWAGKRDLELAEETGVPDAIFCHNARFMAVAGSKEGAMHLADLALNSS